VSSRGIVFFNAEHIFDSVLARLVAAREHIVLCSFVISRPRGILTLAGARMLLNSPNAVSPSALLKRETRSTVRDIRRVEGVEEKLGRVDRFTTLRTRSRIF
jgi:hypothetical protein